ncbi:MAG: hypothetical protein DRN95_06595 [Candidatus Hydrothermarchaeota archaeon]|nr:MAG: hypothetical protein DRN95_06595 [Candidatus Hydrothermarchaeota archaeon]
MSIYKLYIMRAKELLDKKIEEVMKRREEVITVKPEDSVQKAIELLNGKISGLPVVDDEDYLVGVVSNMDILRELSSDPERLKELKVKDVMSTYTIISLSPHSTVRDAIMLMTKHCVHRIFVINLEDEKKVEMRAGRGLRPTSVYKLLGVFSASDVVRLLS